MPTKSRGSRRYGAKAGQKVERAMHEMMMGMHHPMGMDGMKHEGMGPENPGD